jgi:hypothetical protein
VSDTADHNADAASVLPEPRALVALQARAEQVRRQSADCEALAAVLRSLCSAAGALSSAGLTNSRGDVARYVHAAPASAHTVCSLIRDFALAFNAVSDLVDDEWIESAEPCHLPAAGRAAPTTRSVLAAVLDDSMRCASWDGVGRIGLGCVDGRALTFERATAMAHLRDPSADTLATLRPVLKLSHRAHQESHALLDTASGPVTLERAAAQAATRRIERQIDHLAQQAERHRERSMAEAETIDAALVRVRRQNHLLVRMLTGVAPPSTPD